MTRPPLQSGSPAQRPRPKPAPVPPNSARYQDAASVCRESARLYPTHPETYTLLGDILAVQGRYQEAIDNYQLAIAQLPPNIEALRKRLNWTIDRLREQHNEADAAPPAAAADTAATEDAEPIVHTYTITKSTPEPAPAADPPPEASLIARHGVRIILVATIITVLLLVLNLHPLAHRRQPPISATPIPLDGGTDMAWGDEEFE